MWIFLAIIGFIALLITVILLLPVKIIIKSDENNELILRYKFLFKTFGEHPNPDDPIVKALVSASGANRLKTTNIKKSIQSHGLQTTVSESYSVLSDFFKELLALLKICTVTRLRVKIRCTGDGPDQVAIHYGFCCTATYGLLNILNGFFKVRKKGCDIKILSDFSGGESEFSYEAILSVRAAHVLAAFWRIVMAEVKRMRSPQAK